MRRCVGWGVENCSRGRMLKQEKVVQECLLNKARGSPPLPFAFTSLTATLALFDIPPLCSAALQIPLSHLHSLKAHFH